MFKPTIPEIIGELMGLLVVVAILGWAIVSFFPVTWGQALVISWAFTKLLDVLRSIGRW
jgi:hypothetical protein